MSEVKTSIKNHLVKIETSANENLNKPVLDPWRVFKKINDDLIIGHMDAADMRYAMSHWALQEKWTPTQYSLEPFLAADKNGFYMLFVNGVAVASLAAVRYPNLKIAFLGLFLVDKNERRKGYSKILWDNIIPELQQQGYTLGLNASPYAALATPDFYVKLGFQVVHIDQAWQLTENKPLPELVMPDDCQISAVLSGEVLQQVIAYDSVIFGEERKEFISSWITKPETFAFAAVCNNKVVGYIVASKRILPLEPGKDSYRIGPLFADNENYASALLHYVLEVIGDVRPVVMDLPGNNIAAGLMEHFGFTYFYDSVHMFTEAKTTGHDDKVYGKTSVTIAHR